MPPQAVCSTGPDLAQNPPSPLKGVDSLPAWSCSRDRDRDRDTADISSAPPTRDALATGPDVRMKEGMKTRREGRGQGRS